MSTYVFCLYTLEGRAFKQQLEWSRKKNKPRHEGSRKSYNMQSREAKDKVLGSCPSRNKNIQYCIPLTTKIFLTFS